MNTTRQRLLTLTTLCLVCRFASAEAVPGGVYAWPLPDEAEAVRYNDRPVMTYAGHALVGIPINTPPGTATLHYRLSDGAAVHEFTIADKQYTEQHIEIANQAMVDPPPATLARIREESARQRTLYATRSPQVDLSAGFAMPLQGVTTSLFGHRRFFNGQARSPHSGLDIAADTGTPIQAAANATVTLADELYFNGNTLFLDHGQGLITMYCHMSKLLVGKGDRVTRGQPIGLVGATGRVTGPHLHWSVSLNGTRVDPTTFMAVLNSLVETDR